MTKKTKKEAVKPSKKIKRVLKTKSVETTNARVKAKPSKASKKVKTPRTPSNAKLMTMAALTASVASVTSFTGTVVGGTLSAIADTASSAHKLVGVANSRVQSSAERIVMTNKIQDRVKRDDLELEVTEHLVSYGERQENARERAEALADDTVQGLEKRKDVYWELLGLETAESVATS